MLLKHPGKRCPQVQPDAGPQQRDIGLPLDVLRPPFHYLLHAHIPEPNTPLPEKEVGVGGWGLGAGGRERERTNCLFSASNKILAKIPTGLDMSCAHQVWTNDHSYILLKVCSVSFMCIILTLSHNSSTELGLLLSSHFTDGKAETRK